MPIDSAQFRATLGRFPTGVTVVSIDRPDTGVHGITVASFTSLSLTPPLVGVAIGHKSRAHSMLASLSRFGVSILAEGQGAVSDHFAGRAGPIDEPFELLDGHPVVRGAAAQLICLVVNQVIVGDHTLVVGRVELSRLFDHGSLAYGSGRYGRVALD